MTTKVAGLLALPPEKQAHALADAIASPVTHWPGNCYAVALAAVRSGLLPGAVVRYGLYLGPVAPAALRHGFSAEKPMQRHGWVELVDGRIYDPTWWVFQAAEVPYVRIVLPGGPSDEYDAGSNTLHWVTIAERGYPQPGRGEEHVPFPVSDAAFRAMRRVVWGLGGLYAESAGLTVRQLHFFANCPPQWFGLDGAREIYGLLEAAGHGTLVPEDHWRDVMESGSLAPLHGSVPRWGVLADRDPPNPLADVFAGADEEEDDYDDDDPFDYRS
jgi:hypothetical protein